MQSKISKYPSISIEKCSWLASPRDGVKVYGASPSKDPSNMTETAAELGPCCVYYFVPVKVKVEAEAGLICF